MNHELQLATCNTFFMFFLFVCWLPLDGMLSHSHTVLVVCLKQSQRRFATWPSPERTAPLMVRKTWAGSFDTQNARSGGEKWRVVTTFWVTNMGSCRWRWYFPTDSKGIFGFLDEFWGKVQVKHGGQSPVILNSGILWSGMWLYERSE